MPFTNEADVHLLLSCLQPAAHSQQLLQILKASQEPEPKANVGGNLTVAVIKTPEGRQSFRVSIDEGKRKHDLERVEQVRQSAQSVLREKITIKDGRVLQSNYSDYEVARMSDVPHIEIKVVSTDNHPTGGGEEGVPLVACAVGNAIATLTGVRLHELPFSPDRVRGALGA